MKVFSKESHTLKEKKAVIHHNTRVQNLVNVKDWRRGSSGKAPAYNDVKVRQLV
jgi:hypothetical protein